MLMRVVRIALLTFGTLALTTVSAWSGPLYYCAEARAEGWGASLSGLVRDENAQWCQPGTATAAAGMSFEGDFVSGSASAGAGGTHGGRYSLGARAVASAYTGASGQTRATATATAQWHDQIQIVSDELPFGTVVAFAVDTSVSGHMSIGYCQHPSIAAFEGYLHVDQLRVAHTYARAGGGQAGSAAPDCTSGFDVTVNTVDLRVGQIVNIWARLAAWVDTTAPGFAYLSDASHTMTFTIDPLGTNYSYTTASGFSYQTPTSAAVPEPTSLLLLATGAGAVVARRRRSRAR